jgi:hypothetical protein
MKIEQLKEELRSAIKGCESYEQMINQVVIYIVKNFKLKKRNPNG